MIGSSRGRDSTTEHTFDRILSCLLTEIDGIGQKKEKENKVILLGATSVYSELDEALLRAGRFDIHIQLTLPDFQGRREIISKKLEEMGRFCYGKDSSEFSKFVEYLAGATHNYTPAQLINLCQQAALYALHLYFSKAPDSSDPSPLSLHPLHFQHLLHP